MKSHKIFALRTIGFTALGLLTNASVFGAPRLSTKPAIISYNREVRCENYEKLFTPSTAEEVVQIILQARQENKKVRAIGSAHTINSQICTDGFVMSTQKLNRILSIQQNSRPPTARSSQSASSSTESYETVAVEPGVQLGNLSEWLHERGRTLGYAQIGYRGVTVGGVIATGSHGSSVKHSASMSSLVESITLVDSFGQIKEFTPDNTADNPDLMKALRTHLGVFGIVVQVQLRIQPQFNLHMRTEFSSDERIFNPQGLLTFLKDCDYGEALWFPNTEKIIKLCGTETLEPANLGADNDFLKPNVFPSLVTFYQNILNIGTRLKNFNLLLESSRFKSYQLFPSFRKLTSKGRMKATHEVIGPSHKMVSSSLLSNAVGFPQANWEIAIPLFHVQEALHWMKYRFKSQKLALPTMGALLRFIPAESSTLLAHNVAQGEYQEGIPVALIEFTVYRPSGLSEKQMQAYWQPYREIIETFITQYGGRPHWGKNQDWMFQRVRDSENYGANWNRFLAAVRSIDPDQMFSNEFGKTVFQRVPEQEPEQEPEEKEEEEIKTESSEFL